jgi:transmembrane sensor
MPFRVINSTQIVEVLGTHFNIMAYPDESSTNTTLLEGSVRIIKENKSKIISPGQQTRVKNGDIDVASVDVTQVTAWKEGLFHVQKRRYSKYHETNIPLVQPRS